MGTQIQSETYFSRHCSRNYSRNIGTGRWLSYQDGKVPANSQYEDSSSPRLCLIDRYSGHDKVKVKGTMLEHEVTFRHQVGELHRLYRRQRELMNEIQDDKLYKFQKKTVSSQSVISESAKRTWDGSHFLSSDFRLGRFDSSSSRAGQPPSNVIKGKSCESFNPSGHMYLRKPVHLDISGGTHKTIVERSFGLVGNRVGCEDRTKDPLQERAYFSSFNNTVKYHISAIDSESNVLSKGRNYLNEPFQFLSSSSSLKGSCSLSCHADKLEKQNLTDNVSSGFFLHSEISQNSMPTRNGRSFLNRSLSGFDGNGEELKSNGFKFSTDLSLHVEHNTESRKKRKIFGVEIAEGDDESYPVSSDANNSYAIPNGAESDTLPCLSGKAFASHLSKKASSPRGSHGATTIELSWLKLGSCLQNLEFVGGMDARDDLKISAPKSELFHQSSLCVHSQLNPELIDGGVTQSLDMWKGKNGLTSLPDLFEFQDSSNSWKSVNSAELKATKFLKLDSEITNMSENVSHHFFNITERTDIPSKKSNLQISTKDTDDKKGGHAIEKRVGFPSAEGNCKIDVMDLPTDVVSKKCPTRLSANSNAPDKSLNTYISGLRNHIDLNLSIDEAVAPAAAILPAAVVKIVRPEIDLEVPSLIESEVEHGGTKSLDKSEVPHQCPINEAAEALVVISSTLTNDVASYATCHLENTSDCLHWLAGVICSYTSDGDGVVGEISQTIDDWVEEAVPDGMDYFEFMTLQLKDLKEETYCYSLSHMEHQNAEETEMSATKRRSRRGHGRRGRQQKDFKKDVLPELVSLAKQEVIEDLHTLEELFNSAGKTWKSSLSRRNNAKKGRRSMKLGESLQTPEANPARLPSKQKQTGRELQLRGKSLTGWGKRTRRLPRQRCSKKSCSSIQLLTCA